MPSVSQAFRRFPMGVLFHGKTFFPSFQSGTCWIEIRQNSSVAYRPVVSAEKLNQLRMVLSGYRSCVIAYSGGVDSVFLARIAFEVLGNQSLAVIADSPSLPRRELEEALTIGQTFGFPVEVVRTSEFSDNRYLENPLNRCYFCKNALFAELVPLARARGFDVVVYGENASDIGDHRPGGQAAHEFSIRAPLKEVGLTKLEIRKLSGEMGLPTADKPEMACLSSRIPTGETVTIAKLQMVEAAEYFLRDAGFYDVRVRHHELPVLGSSAKPIYLARIQVGATEFSRFLEAGRAEQVELQLKKIGYQHVTVDLAAYRRGPVAVGMIAVPQGSE